MASFFGGISQDMMVPILPLYMTNVLHFDKMLVGLIDGMLVGSATLFKIIAGFASDKMHRRKSIVMIGYFLSWISRPLLALTGSGMSVLLLRAMDGIGKGVKDSPKEALIADSTQVATRGKSFGIVRMFDTFGSVVGPIILSGLLYGFRNTTRQYQYIFIMTSIPLGITLLILAFLVHDVPTEKQRHHAYHDIFIIRRLPLKFYLFLSISLIFSIGNFSDSFIILQAKYHGANTIWIPFLYALCNMVYALGAIPLGILSDRIGRPKVILAGWAICALVYIGFIYAHGYQLWILFALYGLYYATTYGVSRAFIADLVPAEHRGKAYGIYNAVTGFAALPASFIAGSLWDAYGSTVPFVFGAGLTMSAVVLFFFAKIAKAF